MKPKYNSLKKRVLKILIDQESSISCSTIARQVNLPYAARGLYSYLRRLAKFGLVEVGRGTRRRVYYRITEHGKKRFEFLTKKSQ
jgi:DNA-binding PadR family transcriptional regulator